MAHPLRYDIEVRHRNGGGWQKIYGGMKDAEALEYWVSTLSAYKNHDCRMLVYPQGKIEKARVKKQLIRPVPSNIVQLTAPN